MNSLDRFIVLCLLVMLVVGLILGAWALWMGLQLVIPILTAL